MKYLILLLLLISCSFKDCRVAPNATVQTKIENKNNIDFKSESKSVIDQIRDLRDNLQPVAQLKCNY
jgi:thioredoxin-related protein